MTQEYREIDIPLVRLSRPYVEQLDTQSERLSEQLDALEKQMDQVYDDARPSLDALEAKVPEKNDQSPTAVEWLTHRSATADLDVAVYTRDLAAAEVRLKYAKTVAERDALYLRISQVDHLAEGNDPVLSAGNDDELAIWTLTAQEAAIELATAETVLRLSRQRLEHAKKARREIQAALRRVKREETQAAKK